MTTINMDACWIWPGNPAHRYGSTKVQGRQTKIHRYLFAAAYGADPGDLEVCHSCDNPKCVNPAHLFLGTHIANMADMVAKGRQRCLFGEENKNSKLDDTQVRIIRERRAAGESRRALAVSYGISELHISRIVQGLNRIDAGGPLTPARAHKPYKNRKAA